MDRLVYFVFAMIGFGVAVIFHEQWHARVALWLGDPTPKNENRLSWNPVHHVDPILSVVFPLFTMLSMGVPFGGAKPVRVNFANMANPGLGMVLVAAAGPLSNLLLAACSFGLMTLLWFTARTSLYADETVTYNAVVLTGFLMTNLMLAAFNILPFPGLDGSRILCYFLPRSGQDVLNRIEPIALLLTFILVRAGAGNILNPIYGLFHAAVADVFGIDFLVALGHALTGS